MDEVTRSDDAVRIPLRARDGSVRAYAIVDAADAEWASQWRWHLLHSSPRHTRGYAVRKPHVGGRSITVFLHRELLGLVKGDGMDGDHIDRDRLNCRRNNLRALPKLANQQNTSSNRNATSIHRGVSFDSASGKWRAAVGVNGRTVGLGRFSDELVAAEVARAARLRVMSHATD